MKVSKKTAAIVLLSSVLLLAFMTFLINPPYTCLPQYTLHGVWGSSSSDVFAVGSDGVIIHYDGYGWSRMKSNIEASLYDVWGTSPSNVYAVGDGGMVLHYDGSKWSDMDSGTSAELRGVWGSSPTNVYAVGDKGTILAGDGKQWDRVEDIKCNLWDVWGRSANDIYAVGGTVLHFNGSGWEVPRAKAPLIPEGSYGGVWSSVWGNDSGDIFVTSYEADAVFHYNGSTWTAQAVEQVGYGLASVWGVSPDLIFAVGDVYSSYMAMCIYKYNDDKWEQYWCCKNEGRLSGVWGTSATDVFAVGTEGTILHYDGAEWVNMRYKWPCWLVVWLPIWAGVVALTGVGLWLVRRRRAGVGQGEEL